MKVKMVFSPNVFYFLLFILIDVAVKSQMSSNSNSHAFIQENNENVRYIVDSIPITMHKEFSSSSAGVNLLCTVQKVEESTNFNSKAHLKFEPNLLDFKQRALGVPHHEKVTIINLHANKTLHMSSISGNTVHFHSSFFEDKVIPPLGNTSFNVVFLGREEGEIESSLYIHTSEGSFKYQVKGSSLQSPYRLRPLYGVRLPLNATFSPLIHMHNPFNAPLQLVEVYSSGGEFHLELPGGELEGPRHLWEIPAFLTKPVIRVRFHARSHKNHTAYIRLKVSRSEEVLVVPLEVEVGSGCGLYSTDDAIDFGLGGSDDPPKTLKLFLRNSWKKPIKIQNVINTPVSKALRIEFEPVKVPAESEEDTEVARLTFDWGVALETGQTSGRIVVKGKQSSQRLVLPYTATVLAGGLGFNPEVTRFRSVATDSPPPPRTFRLTNNFKLPVAITNVSLPPEARAYFQVTEFVPGILSPGQTVDLFQIAPILSPQLTLDTSITVLTNVSQLSVPLLCYNGKLTKVIPPRNESQLELGTVGSGTDKQVVFALVNENPVPVTIKSWESSLANFAVTIAAIRDSNVSSFLSQPHHSLYNLTTQERTVGPGQYAVVIVKVHAGTQLGDTLAHLTLKTDFEQVQIPAHMRVEHGSLQVTPDPVIFNDCFPGKVCTEPLRVQSLFSVAMAVTSVSGGDAPLSFHPSSPSLLLPASTSTLGTLSYDTRQQPPQDNYLNITHNITGRWQDTVELAAHWADYDLGLLAARYDHFLNLSSRLINLTLRLDTTEVREHEFGARVRLGWPRISQHLSLPLTQVGHSSRQLLTVSNPSSHQPLLVQLVLENSYPGSVVHNFPPGLRPESLTEAQVAPTEFTIDTRNSEYKWAGTQTHRDSWLFLLPPTTNTSVTVNFTPTGAQLSTTHLLLRNNLTVLEAVRLSGSGAFTQFKFGNRKPGSSTPLLFELAEKHLKDCERERQRKLPAPNLTVKRSFTARNTGALPISVRGFDISGIACEGYGFRVLNCEAFDLPPNATRKVDIAFTPDLTLARVQRTLGVWTSDSDNVANYTLVATLPPFLLSSCSAVLARPTWEPLLYYCAITFMMFLLVCVLAAAFLESDRALKCALLAMSRDNATVQPVLDLKSIGTGVGLGQADSASSNSPPAAVPHEPPSHEVKERERESVSVGVATAVSGLATASSATKLTRKKEREKTSLSKRISEPTDTTLSTWTNVFTKPVTISLPKPQPKPVISTTESSKPLNTDTKRKLSKKNSNPGRSVREVPSLPLPMSNNNNNEDTETSSTTTESSHDDGDKEVETLTNVGSKSQRQRNKVATEGKKSVGGEGNNGSASSLELEWEDDKVQTNARSRKSSSKNGKTTENGQSSGSSGRNKSSNGGTKQTNSRSKEKQPLTLKRSIEKLPSLPKPVVLEAPPPPMSMWDESRASFSDVVARSDTSKQNTQPLPLLQTPPAPLGPIGSKKTYTSVWDWDSELSLPSVSQAPPPPTPLTLPPPAPTPIVSPPPPQPSSYFMHSRPSSALLQNTSWEPNLILKMLQAEEQRRLEAETRPRPTYQVTDTWSPWEPLAEPTPCVPQPPHPAPWGSDVWAPPPPDTWAPPGLAPRPPPRLDDTTNPQIDVGLEYDPFRSLSNIWSPHTANIWKPPTTSNN